MIAKRFDGHPETTGAGNPLRALTEAQFAALGGDTIAFIRPISGEALSRFIEGASFEGGETYQLVMSADGTPLLVADTAGAVAQWLETQSVGLATLH